VPVDKIFVKSTPEPKVKAYIFMYEPLDVIKCQECEIVIAELKELIRIKKGEKDVGSKAR